VGGVPGCEGLLAAVRDPSHEVHNVTPDRRGGAFEPIAFEFDAVNRAQS